MYNIFIFYIIENQKESTEKINLRKTSVSYVAFKKLTYFLNGRDYKLKCTYVPFITPKSQRIQFRKNSFDKYILEKLYIFIFLCFYWYRVHNHYLIV